MTTDKKPTPNHPVKRSRKKFFLALIAVIPLAIVLLYFVVTSSAFITSVVLPRVGGKLDSKITAQSVQLKPFSGINLSEVTWTPNNAEPLIQSGDVRVQYSLMDIIGGRIVIHSVELNNAEVQVIQTADGRSNLDPILEALAKLSTDEPEDPSKSSEPVDLKVSNVTIKDSNVRVVRHIIGGGTETVSLGPVNLTLDQLGNQMASDLDFNIPISLVATSPEASVTGSVVGNSQVELSQDLFPLSILSSVEILVTDATGTYEHLNDFKAILDSELTSDEIRRLSFTGYQGETSLAKINVSGPFNYETLESDLDISLENVDRHLLNLSGLHFGDSQINGLIHLQTAAGAKSFTAQVDMTGTDLSVQVGTNTTPVIQTTMKMNTRVNLASSTLSLDELNVNIVDSERTLATLTSNQALGVDWSETPPKAENVSLNLSLNQFDLKPWTPLTAGLVDSGIVDVQLRADQAGQLVDLQLDSSISNLSTPLSPIDLSQSIWTLNSKSSYAPGGDLTIAEMLLVMQQGPEELARVQSSGTVDPHKLNANLNVNMVSSIPSLLKIFPVEGVTSTRGPIELRSQIQLTEGSSVLMTHTMAVRDFDTRAMDIDLAGFDLTTENRVTANLGENGNVEVDQTRIRLHKQNQSALDANLQASMNLTTGATVSRVDIIELNEVLLQPILKPFLADGILQKGLVKLSMKADMPSTGNTEVSGQVSMEQIQFLANDTETEAHAPGLYDLKADWDMAITESTVQIRKGLLEMAPTYRATNQVDISGTIPLNTLSSEDNVLMVKSSSLDITPWFDRIFGQPSTVETTEEIPPVESEEPTKEPEPVQLPIDRFIANLDFERFYLRDIVIRNWNTRFEIRENRIKVDPFTLNLNNAPLAFNLNLDLNEPGYIYDTMVKADGVPLAPFANSFAPLLKDRMNGQIHLNTALTGRGITGMNLREHLKGQSSMTLTNASITLVGPMARNFILPIATLLRQPALLKPPLHYANSRINFGTGSFDIQEFLVQSPAFEASVAGQIRIADNIMQSNLDLPIRFAVRKTFLESKPTEGDTIPYTTLPSFATLQGSLGDISLKTDKLAISGLVLQSAFDITGKTGMKVGETAVDTIKGFGGLLNEMQPFGKGKKDGEETKQEPDPQVEDDGNPFNNLFKKLPGTKN